MPTQRRLLGIPVASIMIGSILPILPFIATSPLLPPVGFLMLIAWRLRSRLLFPVWAPLPLGLFDDLISGQPVGSSMILWTLAFLIMDVIDRRMFWRDAMQEWAIASGMIAGVLVGGLVFANLGAAGTSIAIILPQIILSILLFPLLARFCAWLDRLRLST